MSSRIISPPVWSVLHHVHLVPISSLTHLSLIFNIKYSITTAGPSATGQQQVSWTSDSDPWGPYILYVMVMCDGYVQCVEKFQCSVTFLPSCHCDDMVSCRVISAFSLGVVTSLFVTVLYVAMRHPPLLPSHHPYVIFFTLYRLLHQSSAAVHCSAALGHTTHSWTMPLNRLHFNSIEPAAKFTRAYGTSRLGVCSPLCTFLTFSRFDLVNFIFWDTGVFNSIRRCCLILTAAL